MNDAEFTYIKYLDENRNKGQTITNTVGAKGYFFMIYSYYRENMPKYVSDDRSNIDLFFMRLIVKDPTQIEQQ